MSHAAFAIRDWNDNVWRTLADRWMLVTAGTAGSWNTMTASWGGFGHLWNEDVAFVFVRPTRHTYGFVERAGTLSLSFFDPGYREALKLCGSVSGRDVDKAKATGLTPAMFGTEGEPSGISVPAFREASLVLACRRLYAADLDPAMLSDPSVAKHYPKGDWHRMYIVRIEAAWAKSGER